MLVRDVYGMEYHLNPNQIVLARTMSDGDSLIEMSNDTTVWLDAESYKRVVAWIEGE